MDRIGSLDFNMVQEAFMEPGDSGFEAGPTKFERQIHDTLHGLAPHFILYAESSRNKLQELAKEMERTENDPDRKCIEYQVGLTFCYDLFIFNNAEGINPFIEKLNSEDKVEFVTRMFTTLSNGFPDDATIPRYVAEGLVFGLKNTENVDVLIGLVPNEIYTPEQKALLLSLTTDKDWDRAKILKKLRFLPTDIALPLARGVLHLYYEEDTDDFTRAGNQNSRTSRTERTRTASDELEDEQSRFFAEIEQLYGSEGLTSVQANIKKIKDLFENPNYSISPDSPDTIFEEAILIGLNELPNNSQKFNIHHERMNKNREIPDFKVLLEDRILKYYKYLLTESSNINVEVATSDTLDVLVQSLQLYKNTCENVCPILVKVQEFAETELLAKGIWFSGRDGIPMHLAVKAGFWGEKLGPKGYYQHIIQPQIDQDPKLRDSLIELAKKERASLGVSVPTTPDMADELLVEGKDIYYATEAKIYDLLKIAAVSRLVFENAGKAKNTEEANKQIRQYIVDLGIHTEMTAMDTGFSGTVIKKVLDLLDTNSELSASDMDARLALINANESHVRALYPINKTRDAPAYTIERLPKKNERTIAIEDAQPIIIPSKADIQHLSWVVDHAIMRNFAPRAE